MCDQYHGGTNFGRTAGGPYIITSYDYNTPLDEYGASMYIITWYFPIKHMIDFK